MTKIVEEPKSFLLSVKIDNKGKEEKLRIEDCPIEYRVVSDTNATAGVIIYGRYPRGWVRNPQLRHLVTALMTQI